MVAAPIARTIDRREQVISFACMIAFDVGLSIFLFNYSRAHGATELQAYLLSMIGPLVSILVEFVRHRRMSHFSVFILSVQALAAAITLIGSTDPKVLLLKDSALSGGLGLIFLGSMLVGKPVTYYFGQKFAGDGTPETAKQWDALWDAYPRFRRTQRLVCVLWGVGFLVEAVLRVIAVYTLSFDAAYNVGSILPLVVVAVLLGGTFALGARSRKAGAAARRAEAERAGVA